MLDRTVMTLLSDFGLQDGYVGVMKGIIARIAPHAHSIDISHEIPPQNLLAGRFCLMNAYPYFPRGTVHLAVVDPGVGGQRRGVAVRCREGYLVGPDNGLLSGVFSLSPPIFAVSLTNPDYWLVPVPSATFHGRDIFAPVAAHLAGGVPLEMLGEAIDPASLVDLPIDPPVITGDRVVGTIQSIDRFGNLITDIPADWVAGQNWSIELDGQRIPHCRTYSDGEIGDIIPLIGSHGGIEIAVYRGNAEERLHLSWGDRISIVTTGPRNVTGRDP